LLDYAVLRQLFFAHSKKGAPGTKALATEMIMAKLDHFRPNHGDSIYQIPLFGERENVADVSEMPVAVLTAKGSEASQALISAPERSLTCEAPNRVANFFKVSRIDSACRFEISPAASRR
jgi:hypothetical protein